MPFAYYTGKPITPHIAATAALGSRRPPAASPASPQERLAAFADERPEAAAGAAFAGGLLLALILKRLAR